MPGADVGGLLRSGVASLCLAAGVLHVSAAADHRGMAGHVAFFLVVAVGQSALGAALLLGRPDRWLAAGSAVNLAVAGVWVLSRTTGLPVDGSSAPEAVGLKDGISTVIEIGALSGAGLWWLLPAGARRVALPSGRRAAMLLGTGVWAVGAAGLFAGHTHSAGHTHAARHAHVTAAPDGAGRPHGEDPGHQGDHARRAAVDDAAAAGSADDGHNHAAAPPGTMHDPADHHGPEARPTATGPSAAGAPDHGPGHQRSEARPLAGSGHHPDQACAGPVPDDPGRAGGGHDHRTDGGAGGDHRPGDDHDHTHDEGGSGSDRSDEDGGASPLEDVLKLIRPR